MRGASSAPQALAAAGGAGGVYVPLSTGSPMAAAGAGAAAQAPASSAPLPASAPLAKFKVVFLGDSGAGKTSLIKTFIYGPGQFEANYSATIGIDFLAKTIFLADRTVRLQIWDSAGQERFRSLIPSYIRDSSVAIVVYDTTSRPSFVNAGRWIEDVRAERGSDVLIVLVGNKTDMPERRVVSFDEGERRAREEGITFIECSAKLGHNVQQLFRGLATALPGAAGGAAAPAAGGGDGGNGIAIKLTAAAPAATARGDGAAAAGGGGCR